MSAPPSRTCTAERPAARIRDFAGDGRGTSSVEFALVALPFIAVLCVIFEAAFLFLSQQTLDVAVDRASRALRTGEFQDRADGTDPADRLRRIMCGRRTVFFRCDDLRLDLTRTGSFASNQIPPAYDGQKKDFVVSFGTHFECPEGSDVVALRAAVPVTRPFSFLDVSGSAMAGGRQLLTTTAIFRTEPYSGKSCT
ncbi:TadE/TadG family type IV pilus assembly protein [Methylobacterium durans]|jgi:Flp pilus assembly protein TadG|uniref:TadE-like domain-containing protein n=1 Tax=Methylobacterium durans TaxID=2202825 RepID=A0A2U8W283_9HYPH|nr:TadE/TadG family type IV pilus assembly protein [Methylobacterium durans]AWN39610.1 hypothetical protein DK389_02520 [Methylobacterium durans]